jgi:hypothetical protein
MIVQMARAGAEFCLGLAVLIQARFPKTLIRRLIVMCEIQIVLDERGAGVRIVADTVPSHPRVQQRKREQKDDEQDAFESALLGLELGIQVSIDPHRKTSTANFT